MKWNDLTLSDKARMIDLAVKSGITDLNTIQQVYNIFAEGGQKENKLINRINSTSKANFVKRLKDPNRQSIPYGNGIATHRMAYATDDSGAIVYPEVQEIDGKLQLLEERDALESAIARGDTLRMSIPEAEWFTKHYKEYYPKGNPFATGGPKGKDGTYYTEKWKNLPKSYRTEIVKLAREMNIPEDEVSAYYESGKLNPMLGEHGYPNRGRLRDNDSKTSINSAALENGMNAAIYSDPNRHLPNMPYAIPYDESKEIKIKGVGRTTTNALDSLAKYAAITDLPLVEALGIPAQETQMGAIPLYNYGQKGVDSRELANTSYFRNYGIIPAEYMVRDFRYNSVDPRNKFISRDVPPLQHAFEYYKKGNYNRNDPNHTRDVRNRGEQVLKDPNVQEWLKNSPFAKKAKIR